MKQQTMRVIIVDDEPLAIEGLRLRLENMPDVEVIAEATDGEQAIALCQALQPDVVFLDLQLPGINGLEVVQMLQADTMPLVVFVSAYSDYAIQAFELNAVDYLLKPVNLGRLQTTMNRLKERLQPTVPNDEKYKLLKALGDISGVEVNEIEAWLKSSSQTLPSQCPQELVIKNEHNEQVFVAVDSIQWIDAAGDYMCVHTEQDNFIVRTTMKKLEQQLDSKLFARIHKSTMVNILFVERIQTLKNNESLLLLAGDTKLKVSRNYNEAVKQLVQQRVNS